jgi:ribosomal silencing factor RsfS
MTVTTLDADDVQVTREFAQTAADAALDKKAGDVVLLDMRDLVV